MTYDCGLMLLMTLRSRYKAFSIVNILISGVRPTLMFLKVAVYKRLMNVAPV